MSGMENEIETLRAEVERLRMLLLDHEINPDPYVPPEPMYGPPTLMEHLIKESVRLWCNRNSEFENDSLFLKGQKWTSPLLVRLPGHFNVIRSEPSQPKSRPTD